MKIGMILDEVFPPDPRVENEAISLVNNGHEVFLFCLTYGNEETAEIINGIQVKRFLSNTFLYKLSALAYTIPIYKFVMAHKIEKFIAKNSIDILHIHDIRIASAVFRANRKTKLPVVLDLHENRPEIMKFYPHLAKFPGKILISPQKWKKAEEKFIKKSNKVIVVTHEAKKEILNRISLQTNKITVLPNTVRKSFFEKSTILPEITIKYSNNFVLLYIGDTGIRRGLITSIQSVAMLKETIRNLKLVIVGKNSTDNILKQLVKDLKIEKFVDFLGWQDAKLFNSYISCSDICISPLYRNLHHDTTYANKLFQYMSLEKPILVSNSTAQKEVVEKVQSGLVHEEKNVLDFTEKVLKLYRNKDLRNRLAENGKNFVRKEFYWEKTSKNLLNLYNTFEV
ncbi:glycosyltransferase family 4 protein [Polaribacter batillariae]|uniref:Glycosyltransferase family 4 protein n=1 Tax=Polaribacter batillariae TaxID=2808900 RepID=A0ABX7SSH4_9FLAO|nr:glycosyltransferase family 4 protein [Polaribacter batillariae]QTD37205.1 glycosyltransferase family 4 protein [Polaribacter batillariae]